MYFPEKQGENQTKVDSPDVLQTHMYWQHETESEILPRIK
jgi:hypothetical protein